MSWLLQSIVERLASVTSNIPCHRRIQNLRLSTISVPPSEIAQASLGMDQPIARASKRSVCNRYANRDTRCQYLSSVARLPPGNRPNVMPCRPQRRQRHIWAYHPISKVKTRTLSGNRRRGRGAPHRIGKNPCGDGASWICSWVISPPHTRASARLGACCTNKLLRM